MKNAPTYCIIMHVCSVWCLYSSCIEYYLCMLKAGKPGKSPFFIDDMIICVLFYAYGFIVSYLSSYTNELPRAYKT